MKSVAFIIICLGTTSLLSMADTVDQTPLEAQKAELKAQKARLEAEREAIQRLQEKDEKAWSDKKAALKQRYRDERETRKKELPTQSSSEHHQKPTQEREEEVKKEEPPQLVN